MLNNPDLMHGLLSELDAIEKVAVLGQVGAGLAKMVGRAARGVKAIGSGITGQGIKRALPRSKGFIGPMPLGQKALQLTPEMRRKAIFGGMKAMAPAAGVVGGAGLAGYGGYKALS